MNYITILLLLIVALSAWASFKRGFIFSALALLAWVGSLAAGFYVYAPLSSFLLKIIPVLGVWASPLSFVVGVIAACALLDYIAGFILKDIPRGVHTNLINKLLGILPGIVNGLIWAAFLSVLLLIIPLDNPVSDTASSSKFAVKLSGNVMGLQDKLSPVFSDAMDKGLPRTKIETDEESTVKLPFTVANPTERADLEAEMLELVNKEREERGIKPLKADIEIAVAARKHSADMFARGYFSHYTPEGATPFDRMKKEGIRFITAGENLALAPTLAMAHKGLMESPGHRANILNPAFGRLGIAILDGGIRGLMITQNFRN